MKRNYGVTLIELMIACAIVAILAAIAVPSYTAYIQRGNRTDATGTMTNYAQSLERCYSQAFTYVGCAALPASPSTSPQGFYSLTVTFPTTSSYLITASPVKAPQTSDSACTQLTLNSAGGQGATPSGNTQKCWGSS